MSLENESKDDKMSRLFKSRAGARSWVTRTERMLGIVCEDISPDDDVNSIKYVKLRDAVNDFDKRVATLEVKQSEYEELLADEDLDRDINEAFVFMCKAKEARIEAEFLLSKCGKDNTVTENYGQGPLHGHGSHVSEHSCQSGVAGVKLPKLELTKFDGTITEWQTFWDKFCALVDKAPLPIISKFSYLQSLLTGEARSVIQGLAVTENNYEVACKLLMDRYGRRERIVFAHIQALLSVAVPVSNSKGGNSRVSNLWQLQDELLSHIRSLEALGIKGQDYGIFMTPVILSRLPHDMRMEWARDGEGKEADLEGLLNFLRKEIERRERSETFKTFAVKTEVQGAEEKRPPRSTASALQTSSGCGFCGQSHASDKCWKVQKMSVTDRLHEIRTAKLCFRCLDKNHYARACKAKCSQCKGRHHLVICNKQGNEPVCAPRVQSESNTAAHVSNNVGVACSTSRSDNLCTVLHTATLQVAGVQRQRVGLARRRHNEGKLYYTTSRLTEHMAAMQERDRTRYNTRGGQLSYH